MKQERKNRSQRQLVEMSTRVITPNQNCLTIDDIELAERNLPLQQYDAFILFEDADIEFATEMIDKLERFDFKVKLSHVISVEKLKKTFILVVHKRLLLSWIEF